MMKNQLKMGAILGYINMIINIVISFLYVPFLLKYMGQSEYGLYSLVASVIAYLSVLDFGFGNAMVRFISKSNSDKKEVSKINGLFMLLYSIIGIIAFIIGMIITLNANSIFASSLTPAEMDKIKILLVILTINVSITFPLSTFDSYIIANERFVYSKILTIIQSISKPLIMIPLLLLGYKSIAMTCVVAILNILFHIAMAVYCIKKLDMKFNITFKKIDKKLLAEVFAYSFFIFLNIIVDRVFSNTDQIILGIVSGTISVSVYAVAMQFVDMNQQCSVVISSLFLPKITKTLKEENHDKKISDIFISVSRIQIYIMMLIMCGFMVFGQYFIKKWAGVEYLSAYWIVLIIIIPAVIPLTQNIGISVIQAKNQHQFRAIMYIIIAIANIAISIPLAKLYGGIGAAIGTAFANICGQIITMNIFYYKKAKLDIPKYWKFFIKMILQYGLLTTGSIFILNYIEMNNIIFIGSIIIFTTVYFVITYINMNQYEKNMLSTGIKKMLGIR